MPSPKSSSKADWGSFIAPSSEVPFRLIWRSYGPEKSGKNHFGLTAPGPIAIQSFDIGLEGVVEKFLRQGKDIRVCEYEFDKADTSQEAARAICDQFIEDFETALKVARTIIWDTESELWEMFRYAEFGANTQGVSTDAPRNYVKLNANYRDIIQRAYDGNVNLQLIQKVKERWVKDMKGSPIPSGNFEPTGFKEAGYLVQANIRHAWSAAGGFVIHVDNCRQNMEVAGQDFNDESFPGLAQMIFPDSTEENWS